jgi:hypothetical protein
VWPFEREHERRSTRRSGPRSRPLRKLDLCPVLDGIPPAVEAARAGCALLTGGSLAALPRQR